MLTKPKVRKYHLATLFAQDGSGSVSALCFEKPRRINLNKAYWTLSEKGVTCAKCLDKLAQITPPQTTQP